MNIVGLLNSIMASLFIFAAGISINVGYILSKSKIESVK